jgi:hypothetical protein
MPVTQDQPASAKAEQLTTTYQLGTLQREFDVRLTKMTLFGGIVSLIVGGALGFFAYQMLTSPRNINDINNAPILIIPGIIFLLVALYCFFYPIIYSSWHIYIYSEGFAYTRINKVTAFRWDQIESMLQAVTRQYMNGIYVGTNHKYTISGLDGKKIVLNDIISNVGTAGEIIADMVTRVKLPQAIESFQAGNTLNFGKLSISSQGISNGKETIAWEQVKGINVNAGIVTVKKDNQWLSWSSVRVAQIPNFFVFLALVKAIQSQA